MVAARVVRWTAKGRKPIRRSSPGVQADTNEAVDCRHRNPASFGGWKNDGLTTISARTRALPYLGGKHRPTLTLIATLESTRARRPGAREVALIGWGG